MQRVNVYRECVKGHTSDSFMAARLNSSPSDQTYSCRREKPLLRSFKLNTACTIDDEFSQKLRWSLLLNDCKCGKQASCVLVRAGKVMSDHKGSHNHAIVMRCGGGGAYAFRVENKCTRTRPEFGLSTQSCGTA